MPISMKKKWTKAQYGRERYLAKEFLKSKSEQMNESVWSLPKGATTTSVDELDAELSRAGIKSNPDFTKLLVQVSGNKSKINKIMKTHKAKKIFEGLDIRKLENAIMLYKKAIKKQGRVTNARDEEHLKQLIKVYKQMGGKKIKEQMNESKLRGMIREIIKEQMNEKINLGGAYEKMLKQQNDRTVKNALMLIRAKIEKDYKVGKVYRGTKVTQRLIHTKIINGMKELRNKSKSPGLKKAFQDEIKTQEKTLKQFRKDAMDEAYRSQSIFFDKKDKSKLQKLLKKKKGKFPFNPFGEPVVNWSLDDRGSKGIEWSGIPKYNYDKAVEFFMKNKLNPRG